MNNRVKAAIFSAASVVILIAVQAPVQAQNLAHGLKQNVINGAATSVIGNKTSSAAAQAANSQLIVVSLKDRELALVDNGVVKAVYPVAVGKASTPSPTGTFTIVNHVINPTYYHHGIVIPPGRWNPVGNRWMGLSVPGYGIHGTNVQRSVGKAVSHGCIRLRRADIEALFAQVKVGDKVEILGQRDEETAALFGEPVTPQSVHAAAPMLTAKTVPVAMHAVPVTETAAMVEMALPAGR